MFHRPFLLTCRAAAAAALLLTVTVVPAAAQQQVRVEMRAGRVTLHALNAPLRQVLAEWARVGGTKFVNVERVTGAPISVDLDNVSERQALDTLLRGVAGYVLGSRPPSAPGASTIDRVLILAASTAPRAVPQPTFTSGPATRFPQPQFEPNDPEENPINDVGPGQPRPRPGFPQGVPRPVSVDPPQPDPPDPNDDTPGTVETPANPFGLPPGSSTTPGVVTPVPQQQQNRQPRIQDPD
jgi:hypothetical protein